MRLHPLIHAAAAALTVGALATGCSSTSADDATGAAEESAPAQQQTAAGAAGAVKQAALTTKSAKTARVRLEGTMSQGGGDTLTTRGDGVVDFETGDAQMTLSAEVGGQPQEMQILVADGTSYMQMPMLGDVWLRSPQQLAGVTGANPENLLDSIDKVSDLEEVGEEEVEGVAATRYSGSIDLAEALTASGADSKQAQALQKLLKDGKGAAAIDVWVDGEDRIVKIDQGLSVELEGGSRSQSSTLYFSDFGTDVSVQAPDPAKVMDADQLPGALSGTTPAG